MAGEIIRPDQVQAHQMQQILQFLNGANSAQEIAASIELPGEPDIGIALAKRIILQRDNLGGSFTDLQQIIDIPYIGPERFSDLVRGLNAFLNIPEVTTSALAEEIRHIRQQLETLSQNIGAQYHLTLSTNKTRIYLGQSTLIKATLKNKLTGQILVGYPITIFTHWGQLRSLNQQPPQHGSSVSLITASDGVARAMLSPLTAETLSSSQYDALVSALAELPEEASTPQNALDKLQNLANKYQSNSYHLLRQAIDIYLQEFHPNLKDATNQYNLLANWPQQQIAIMALAQGGTSDSPLESIQGDSSVQVSAVCNLSLIDWLPAWLESFIQLKDNESNLSNNFNYINSLDGGKISLAKTFDYYINDFTLQMRGLAGDYAGKRIINNAVNDYIQNDMNNLSSDSQSSLFTNLTSTTKTLAVNGLQGLESAKQQRQVLEQDFSTKYTQLDSFDQMQADIANANSRINTLQQDMDQGFESSVNLSQFNALKTTMEDTFSINAEKLANFESNLAATNTLINDLNIAFEENMMNMLTQLDLNALQDNINLKLDDKADLSKLAETTTALDKLSKSVDDRFNNTVSPEQLKAAETGLQINIDTKADQSDLSDTKTVLSELSQSVDTRFDNTITPDQLKVTETNLQQDIDDKASLAELATVNRNLSTEISTSNTALSTKLDTSVSKLNTDIRNSRRR